MSEQPIVNLKTVQDEFKEPQRADYIGMKVTMACMHNQTKQQPQLKLFEQKVIQKAIQNEHIREHHKHHFQSTLMAIKDPHSNTINYRD